MYPWTTPPTSWPAPPQPTNPSSTSPQSPPNAHLFGHPSPLHPTWSSSSSLMPSASVTPSLPFTSLTPAPHAVPAPQLVPTMPTPMAPETTMVHTAPPAFTPPTAPTAPTAWHSAPASSPTSTTPPTPLQSSPYPPRNLHPPLLTEASMDLWFLLMNLHHRQLRPPQSFAPTRNLTNHVVQLQKPHSLLHHRHQR